MSGAVWREVNVAGSTTVEHDTHSQSRDCRRQNDRRHGEGRLFFAVVEISDTIPQIPSSRVMGSSMRRSVLPTTVVPAAVSHVPAATMVSIAAPAPHRAAMPHDVAVPTGEFAGMVHTGVGSLAARLGAEFGIGGEKLTLQFADFPEQLLRLGGIGLGIAGDGVEFRLLGIELLFDGGDLLGVGAIGVRDFIGGESGAGQTGDSERERERQGKKHVLFHCDSPFSRECRKQFRYCAWMIFGAKLLHVWHFPPSARVTRGTMRLPTNRKTNSAS